MKRYSLALLVVLWACPVAADTWEWVDSQGTVSFTDNLQNIPRQYRRSAHKLDLEVSAPSVPDKAAAPVPAPASPPAGSKAAEPGTSVKDFPGGKSLGQWQEAFDSLDDEIKGVDAQLQEMQRRLKDSGTLSRNEYRKLEEEFSQLRVRRTGLLGRWEALKNEAIAARVPLQLRP